MKKKNALMLMVIILLLTLNLYTLYGSNKTILPSNSFRILGDVVEVLTVTSLDDYTIKELNHKDNKHRVIHLKELLETAKPLSADSFVYLVGNDGLIAKLKLNTIDESYITQNSQFGWETIHLNHPISSNIKNLKEIIVVAEELPMDKTFNIITSEDNLVSYSIGQLLVKGYYQLPSFEGTSTKEKAFDSYSVSIYTTRRVISIASLLEDSVSLQGGILFGGRGEEVYINKDDYIELKGNKIVYFNNEIEIDDVKGVIINPPIATIKDTYHDTLHYLSQNQRVLIIFVDGLGYHQYINSINNASIPFITTLPKASKALSVYQPVTNAGFTAMITGVGPKDSGVYSRAQKDLNVSTIFGRAEAMGKKSVLIEGNIKILNTEIEPVLNLDTDKSGTTDEEVFESAMKHIGKDYDLMLVHFHGHDDMGHQYGDINNETMRQLSLLDGYIKELSTNWLGKVILVSDHGMHSVGDAGNHGVFRYEDMIVPYVVYNGGYEE